MLRAILWALARHPYAGAPCVGMCTVRDMIG
jgi:hypothetical protein